MRIFFSRQPKDAATSLRLFATPWFIFILVIGTMASITAHSTHAAVPYTVTITTSNFRIPFLTMTTDDISDPGNARLSLQNGTQLWYGMNITSTPSGIMPTAANPTSDLVATTFLGTVPLLPPAQVLPFDSWNGSYHFEVLKLKTAFSGPGQQVQLELTPMDQHAITLDVLTLILQLLGQKQSNVQIGLLETGELQDIFSTLGGIKDFTTLIENYSQALQSAQNATTLLPHAYACALNIASLLSDSSEQSALADVLWKVQGKAISRESVLETLATFAQAQFGLGIEGFINNEVSTMAGMFPQEGNPIVLLQTVSTATPSVTHSQSTTPSPTHVPTRLPLTPTATPVGGKFSTPTVLPITPIATSVGGRFSTPTVVPTAQAKRLRR